MPMAFSLEATEIGKVSGGGGQRTEVPEEFLSFKSSFRTLYTKTNIHKFRFFPQAVTVRNSLHQAGTLLKTVYNLFSLFTFNFL